MRAIVRWVLWATFALSLVACGQPGQDVTSREHDLIGYWRARIKSNDGELFDATWGFRADKSFALWIALVEKDGSTGQASQEATGTWSVSGSKLVILAELNDGKSEVQKFTVSGVREKSFVVKDDADGEMTTMHRIDSAPRTTAAPNSAPAKQPPAKNETPPKQERKPALIVQIS